jgi:DNA polymerase-1
MPELTARDYNVRSAAERMAMNAPIQGTAADIIKLAMVAVDKALREGGFKAKLILQVHDELIIDAPREEAQQVSEMVRCCMEQVASLSVPLIVDVHQADCWMEAK